MIALYLLAAHLVGDYLLQTRWQSAGKFGWTPDAVLFRIRHCATYTAAFAPIAVWYADPIHAYTFLYCVFFAHFYTDSRRFTSTPGEWLWWRVLWLRCGRGSLPPIPPNPWPSLPLAIDQTLHVVQIAVFAGLLLR